MRLLLINSPVSGELLELKGTVDPPLPNKRAPNPPLGGFATAS